MSILSRLFGGAKSTPKSEPETYEGFRITPEPIAEGGKYRLAARIEKDVGGETKSHHLIRADTLDSHEAAASAASAKARQLIDQIGESLFDQQY
ncbi:MAG: HlyU family transcriptional regulator [Pseudomonadota bacterium]